MITIDKCPVCGLTKTQPKYRKAFEPTMTSYPHENGTGNPHTLGIKVSCPHCKHEASAFAPDALPLAVDHALAMMDVLAQIASLQFITGKRMHIITGKPEINPEAVG